MLQIRTGNAMSDAITWSETNTVFPNKATERRRLMSLVIWQVAFVSIAAYFSQLLIFDEANWYRIDVYDALTWGLIVTQIFALAVYVSRYRIQTVENSLRIFLCMGSLAAGLTLAAISFLIVDALRYKRDVLPLLGIAGGYWVAVFVFLVSMFLQLRLAIICLQAVRPLFVLKRSPMTAPGETRPRKPIDGNIDGNAEPNEKYSIADIFAFTGLAAVSISAYRLVLGMVTDYDALRFLAMFYAASITVLCVYGLIQLHCTRVLKLMLLLPVVVIVAYAEFYLAQQLRSPLLRFGFGGMLLCNGVIALATTMQSWFLEKSTRSYVE
jgi:hypothetical protein